MFCGIALRFCTLAELGINWAGILGVLGVQRAVLGSLPGGGTRALLWVTRQAGARGGLGDPSQPAPDRNTLEWPKQEELSPPQLVTPPQRVPRLGSPPCSAGLTQLWAQEHLAPSCAGEQLLFFWKARGFPLGGGKVWGEFL